MVAIKEDQTFHSALKLIALPWTLLVMKRISLVAWPNVVCMHPLDSNRARSYIPAFSSMFDSVTSYHKGVNKSLSGLSVHPKTTHACYDFNH